MILDSNTAKKTADLLLQINAIKLNPKNPFVWASGWKSPIYCDNRVILSYPQIRIFIREAISKQIDKLFTYFIIHVCCIAYCMLYTCHLL